MSTSFTRHCPSLACGRPRSHRTYLRQMHPSSYNTPAAPQIPSRPPWLSVTYCLACARTAYAPATAPAA